MNTESAVEPPLTSRRERLRMLANLRRTWRQRVVDSVDQIEILGKAHDESSLDARYLATGHGLLMNSGAHVGTPYGTVIGPLHAGLGGSKP